MNAIRILLILFCSMLSSCATYKFSTLEFLDTPQKKSCFCEDDPDLEIEENKTEALHHPLYRVIPRHRCQIRWFDAGHWMT